MKGELPVVEGRVPHEIKDKLAAFYEETGQTESRVIRDTLSIYLAVNTSDTVESLNKRVAALERQYKKQAQLV